MGYFGDYLLDKGAIAPPQLEEALRSQTVYGGRLGTNLLDRGYLVLEELAIHLSEYFDVPLPPAELLQDPDKRAINVVPMPLIRRYKVFPFKLEKSRIHVVMVDPTSHDQLQYLEMAAERKAIPYVLPEAQLLYWLEFHLDIDRHPRMLSLGSRPRQLDLSMGGAAPNPPESGTAHVDSVPDEDNRGTNRLPATPPQPAADSSEPCDDEEDILLLDELVSEPETSPATHWELQDGVDATSEAEALTSSRVANLEAQLYACSKRDEIVRLGLHISRVYSRAAALFLIRRGVLRGYRANGLGMDAAMSGLEIPLQTASVFTHPVSSRLPFRGTPPEDGIDGRFLQAMGRGNVQEIFIHPILIGGRAVNLLYADNGPDVFGETSIAALTALSDCLARAYGRLITESKKPRNG